MTELLTRTPTSARSREGERAEPVALLSSVWVRGAVSALWASALGCAVIVVVVLIAWAADSRSGAGAGDAIRTALQLWLAGHRVPMHVEGGTIVLAPIGLTLALGWLVARAAAVLARGQQADGPRAVGVIAVAVGVPYAVLAVFVAAAAHSSHVQPDPAVALVAGLVLGTVSAAWGAARGVGLVRACWERLPARVARPLAGGLAATAVLLVGGMLLVVASLTTHAATAWTNVTALGGGAVASGAVLLLDVVLLPNAALAAVGYLSGPGFAVGAGSAVTLGSVHPGSLPALPILAAVPHSSAGVLVEGLVLLVLVGAGLTAAAVVARFGEPLVRTMLLALGAGAVAGTFIAVLVAVAGGSAGTGRMTALGASPWQTGLAVAAEVSAVACGAAGAMTWRRGR